jgi:hypothetical protein
MFRQRCSWSSLWPFCNDPRQLREELNRQNALPKVGRRSWQPFGTCNPILKTGISIRQAFTRCGEFASKLEPSAISSQLAVEKSALINLPLFREVDAELIEKLAECLRVNGFPLCCEVQAIGASALSGLLTEFGPSLVDYGLEPTFVPTPFRLNCCKQAISRFEPQSRF